MCHTVGLCQYAMTLYCSGARVSRTSDWLRTMYELVYVMCMSGGRKSLWEVVFDALVEGGEERGGIYQLWIFLNVGRRLCALYFQGVFAIKCNQREKFNNLFIVVLKCFF